MEHIEENKVLYESSAFNVALENEYTSNVQLLAIRVYNDLNACKSKIHDIAAHVMEVIYELETLTMKDNDVVIIKRTIDKYNVTLRYRARIFNDEVWFMRWFCCVPNNEELSLHYKIELSNKV